MFALIKPEEVFSSSLRGGALFFRLLNFSGKYRLLCLRFATFFPNYRLFSATFYFSYLRFATFCFPTTNFGYLIFFWRCWCCLCCCSCCCCCRCWLCCCSWSCRNYVRFQVPVAPFFVGILRITPTATTKRTVEIRRPINWTHKRGRKQSVFLIDSK